MPATLLSLALLVAPSLAFAHGPQAPPAREAYVCEALLRHSSLQPTWDDETFLDVLRELKRVYLPHLTYEPAASLRTALREVRRDLGDLSLAAFPVKQMLIGERQIREFLEDVSRASRRLEDGHLPALATHPFHVRTHLGTRLFTAATGASATGLTLLAGHASLINGHPWWTVGAVLVAAACANQVLSPAARDVCHEAWNASLLKAHEQGKLPPARPTTADRRALQYGYFVDGVLNALRTQPDRQDQFAWGRLRVRLPLSASARPNRRGSPRAPTADEVGAAVRRSGEFWFPIDARVISVDQFYYYDMGYQQPILLNFIREREDGVPP